MTRLVVLAGPTAVGKGTLVRALRERNPDIWLSVSATTRSPRPGEVEGEHYHFVSEAEFSRMIEHGELLEWATVHGRHRYGTPRAAVEEHLAAGDPSLLEIDLQGARQVRATMPEALYVFIEPPSVEELVRRLVGRGTEDDLERERRLRTAEVEMAASKEFDVIIINDDLDTAVQQLEKLVLDPGSVRGASRRHVP
ncbi:guanylate kinase [Demequina sp. NBRC 110053]|uniref:guanylate kinase n=1 Tax=Demequina sp. NBRC 110053 TaxID=1570342 RepID=UPI0009FDBB9F|nr:guanylate kinase [Demequina sp. NBRC 110053]